MDPCNVEHFAQTLQWLVAAFSIYGNNWTDEPRLATAWYIVAPFGTPVWGAGNVRPDLFWDFLAERGYLEQRKNSSGVLELRPTDRLLDLARHI